MEIEKINYGNFYHLYNSAVGGRNLFYENANYEYFLLLYDKYITPITDTYAWVLMPNHFHFLVRIKDKKEIDNYRNNINKNGLKNFGFKKLKKISSPSQQFSNFFNAYAQALNKRLDKKGSLFEKQFKRKLVSNHAYLRNLILYIHRNPVHHGFCEHPMDYPWSSYLTCISLTPTNLQRERVIGWFDNEANFKNTHSEKLNLYVIEDWLKL